MERLDQYLLRNHTDQSAKSYLYAIDVFLMKQPQAKKLKYADIIDYINEAKKTTKNVNPLLSAVKRYYDYLVETGQRNDHPCKSIRLKNKKKPIQLQDLFTSAELELLMKRENRFSNLELRNKVAISLMIYQALSVSELVRLEIKNIDLEQGTIYVKGGSKTSARTLDLKNSQILLIQKYIETSRANLLQTITDCLLVSQRGTPETVDSINAMVEPLKGLYPDRNLNPTTIRQSVISNLLNEFKKPLEDVQLFAGHKWPSTTEKYRRKDINKQRELINKWHPMRNNN